MNQELEIIKELAKRAKADYLAMTDKPFAPTDLTVMLEPLIVGDLYNERYFTSLDSILPDIAVFKRLDTAIQRYHYGKELAYMADETIAAYEKAFPGKVPKALLPLIEKVYRIQVGEFPVETDIGKEAYRLLNETPCFYHFIRLDAKIRMLNKSYPKDDLKED